MDIRHLQYFITLSECLNFTEAAKRLYISQSVLSQQISEMEKKIGVTLFQRSKRIVRLTSSGTVFLENAIDIVNRYEQTLEKVRLTDQGLIGTLRIGVLMDSFTKYLPPFLQEFKNNYPNIDLKVEGLNNGPLMDKLSKDEIDLAFTVNIGIQYIPDVDKLSLGNDFVSVILSKNHPFANTGIEKLFVLSNENFIMLNRHDSPQGYDKTIQICANNGFSPKVIQTAHSIRDVLFLVEAGLGITILPNYVSRNYSQNLSCIPIENGKYVIDLVAAWRKNNLNPSLNLLIKDLQSYKESKSNIYN